MYYGNTGATTDPATTTGVWISAYKGVWHLPENVVDEGSQADAYRDSTANFNHGYQYGPNEIAAQIYRGRNSTGQ